MKLYMISYSLRQDFPVEKYVDLIRNIKSAGPWRHPTETTWFVLSDMPAADLYGTIQDTLCCAGLIVAEVVPGSTVGFMPKDDAMWLDALGERMNPNAC